MADQEFLASFGVEIDETGVLRLQEELTKNRALAEELADASGVISAGQAALAQLLPVTSGDFVLCVRFPYGMIIVSKLAPACGSFFDALHYEAKYERKFAVHFPNLQFTSYCFRGVSVLLL